MFGSQNGALLWDEAMCEDRFAQDNCIDGVTMEPLDSEGFTPELRRNARTNAHGIEKNIKKLVRVFAR